MEPLLLFAAGIGAVIAGVITLRSFGPGYHIGRLLAATPRVAIADALTEARAGAGGYLAVEGRIDSDESFLDEANRPLVLRRARLEIHSEGRWRTLEERREAVRFVVREGLDEIEVAIDELDEGIVVVPRESTGSAAEVPQHLPPGTPPTARIRYRVDLVSSVDHAIVLGVPRLDASGRALLGAGRRRPLVVSTLKRDEAMRVLAGGRRGRSVAAASLLVMGLALLAGGGAWAVVRALA